MSRSFAGYRFPPHLILLAVRWCLRYGLSGRDIAGLLAERGIDVDHVTICRWVQRFTPLAIEAARPCRHGVGNPWFVDETYVTVTGVWRHVYSAVDQWSQVIDIYDTDRVLVALKGPTRGRPLTADGLDTILRGARDRSDCRAST